MENENPIRTLRDYSRPSHKGYRNTIELPDGNNVVPLRSDTIRLVLNKCSFHGLRSEGPNQHLKDFLKLVDSLDLGVSNREEVENGTNNEEIRSMKEKITREEIEELVEMPRSQPIGYYLKHEINKELIEGIAEDVLVEIASYVYPIDFMILDVKEDKKKPFILGTPFLTIAKAEIRFDKGTITLKSEKNKINFFKIPESPRRVEDRKSRNDIDHVAPNNTLRAILEWEERIKLHQEKEMEFNQ
ncbi:MAK10-like protein [Tanacetum coccineum]